MHPRGLRCSFFKYRLDILSRRAFHPTTHTTRGGGPGLSAGRLAALGARRNFHHGPLTFFFKFAVDHRAEPRRRPERFAMVVQRKIGDVLRIGAARRRARDDDCYGTTGGGPFTKCEAAAASKTSVLKAFQHGLKASYYSSALISFSKRALGAIPMCFLHTRPSRLMRNDAGMP
jgi:hypothetical protein